MRIIHILHRSVPGTHGYAIRSRQIVRSLHKKGVDQIVLTSPSQLPLGELDSERSERIDDVRYFRTCSDAFPATAEVKDDSRVKAVLRVLQNFSMLRTALKLAARYQPTIVHAHSPFTCGIVGNIVGRRRNIPTIYEVRGIWEDSHAGRGKLSENSLQYKGIRYLENLALKRADVCCAICEGLANEIRSRGIQRDRIVVARNGVDTTLHVPGPPPEPLMKRLKLDRALTIGYIGYFFRYEGLDLLLQSMPGLIQEFPNLHLLLVGDGELMPDLREMADQLSLGERVRFTGRVPHEEVADYYRICDVLALPRRETRETRLVTPLKPLEIMAMGKPLVASDIGGHLEIVQDGLNGLLFRSEDVPDLVSKLRTLLAQEALRKELGEKSRTWVETNRDWSILVDRYINLYSDLAERSGA